MTRSSARLVLASSVVSPCGAYPWKDSGRNSPSGFCSPAGSPSHLSWRSFSRTRRSRRRSWNRLITHSTQPCSHLPDRALHLGIGFYVTVLGISFYAGALWISRVYRVPLPVRFAEAQIRRGDSGQLSELGRQVFVLLIAATAIAILVELAIFTGMVPTAGRALPWWDDWPRHFAAFQWLPELLDGLAVAAIALLVFRADRTRLRVRASDSVVWPAAIAIAVPLAVALIPRLFLKGLFNYSTVLSNVPYEILGFGAFPWALIVFAIAALQELVLRVYLQNGLEVIVSFKRACLLRRPIVVAPAAQQWVRPCSWFANRDPRRFGFRQSTGAYPLHTFLWRCCGLGPVLCGSSQLCTALILLFRSGRFRLHHLLHVSVPLLDRNGGMAVHNLVPSEEIPSWRSEDCYRPAPRLVLWAGTHAHGTSLQNRADFIALAGQGLLYRLARLRAQWAGSDLFSPGKWNRSSLGTLDPFPLPFRCINF